MNIKKQLRFILYVCLLTCMVSVPSVRLEAASKPAYTTGVSAGKWIKKGSKLKFKTASKKYVKSKFKQIDGEWFYFNSSGYVVTGKKTINGRLFYFQKTGVEGTKGKMLTGWQTVGKQKYYFRKTGAEGEMGSAYLSEWATIDGKRCYFNQDGSQNFNIMTETQFVKMIGELARQDMKKSGILASVTTAQAILESGYGTTSLGMEAHNLFGMKAQLSGNTWASAWKGATFTKNTMEYLNGKWYTIKDVFRAYDTFAESLADHSAYLIGAMNGKKLRYEGVVGNKSYKKTIKLIKNGGYATDPNYVDKICSIIKRFNLTQYDK